MDSMRRDGVASSIESDVQFLDQRLEISGLMITYHVTSKRRKARNEVLGVYGKDWSGTRASCGMRAATR